MSNLCSRVSPLALERRLWDLLLPEGNLVERWRLFSRKDSDMAGGNGFKWEESRFKWEETRFRLDIREKNPFRVVRHWNRLPGTLWMSHPWKSSRWGWVGLWETGSIWRFLPSSEIGIRWPSRSPSHPNHSLILILWMDPGSHLAGLYER